MSGIQIYSGMRVRPCFLAEWLLPGMARVNNGMRGQTFAELANYKDRMLPFLPGRQAADKSVPYWSGGQAPDKIIAFSTGNLEIVEHLNGDLSLSAHNASWRHHCERNGGSPARELAFHSRIGVALTPKAQSRF